MDKNEDGKVLAAVKWLWQAPDMTYSPEWDRLFGETTRAALAARRWFDGEGKAALTRLPARETALLRIESLRITTRLLAVTVAVLAVRHAGPAAVPRPGDPGPSPRGGLPAPVAALAAEAYRLMTRLATLAVAGA